MATPIISADTSTGLLVIKTIGCAELVINPSDLSSTIRAQAILHGLKQKIVDAAAIARDTDTGRSATAVEKHAAMKDVMERLLAGSWNAIATGSGGSRGLLELALERLYPARDIPAWLESKTDKEKAALRVIPRVASVIEEIKAEQIGRAHV